MLLHQRAIPVDHRQKPQKINMRVKHAAKITFAPSKLRTLQGEVYPLGEKNLWEQAAFGTTQKSCVTFRSPFFTVMSGLVWFGT